MTPIIGGELGQNIQEKSGYQRKQKCWRMHLETNAGEAWLVQYQWGKKLEANNHDELKAQDK